MVIGQWRLLWYVRVSSTNVCVFVHIHSTTEKIWLLHSVQCWDRSGVSMTGLGLHSEASASQLEG